MEFDPDNFVLEVNERRKTLLLFACLSKQKNVKTTLASLQVVTKCQITQANLVSPVRNIGCPTPNCIFDLDNLKDVIFIQSIERDVYKEGVVCPLCKSIVKLEDFWFDLDLAFYANQLNQKLQSQEIGVKNSYLYMDSSGRFYIENVSNSGNKEKKELTDIKPLALEAQEQNELKTLELSIKECQNVITKTERNLNLLRSLYKNCSIKCDQEVLNNAIEQAVLKNVCIQKNEKLQANNIFTFIYGINKQTNIAYVDLYYPALVKWHHIDINDEYLSTKLCMFEPESMGLVRNLQGSIFLIGGFEKKEKMINGKKVKKFIGNRVFRINVDITSKKAKVHEMAPMKYNRIFHSLCEDKGLIYAIAGIDTDLKSFVDRHVVECEVYNPSTDTWKEIKPITYQRCFATVCRISNHRLLLLGGLKVSSEQNPTFYEIPQIECYDIKKDIWSVFHVLEFNKIQKAQVFINQTPGSFFDSATNSVIIFGGKSCIRAKEAIATTQTFNINNKVLLPGSVLPCGVKIEDQMAYTYAFHQTKICVLIKNPVTDKLSVLEYDQLAPSNSQWKIYDKKE